MLPVLDLCFTRPMLTEHSISAFFDFSEPVLRSSAFLLLGHAKKYQITHLKHITENCSFLLQIFKAQWVNILTRSNKYIISRLALCISYR